MAIFILFSGNSWGQVSLDSIFFHPSKIITPLPPSISDMTVDDEGNIYLLSSRKHKIHKYFKANQYDSLQTIGGKGIGKEGFNMPSKIQAPNRQNVYVLDYLNRRLALLNTNLKIVDDLNFLTLPANALNSESVNLFPTSFTVGPSGELYLLNQDDNKIYKYNSFRQLEIAFGGLDYGAGSLLQPEDILINGQNYLFASDPENQRVTVFDLYGIFQYNLELKIPFHWDAATLIEPYIVYFGAQDLFLYNLTSKKIRHLPFIESETIVDIAGNKDFLFILTEKAINLYPLENQPLNEREK